MCWAREEGMAKKHMEPSAAMKEAWNQLRQKCKTK